MIDWFFPLKCQNCKKSPFLLCFLSCVVNLCFWPFPVIKFPFLILRSMFTAQKIVQYENISLFCLLFFLFSSDYVGVSVRFLWFLMIYAGVLFHFVFCDCLTIFVVFISVYYTKNDLLFSLLSSILLIL